MQNNRIDPTREITFIMQNNRIEVHEGPSLAKKEEDKEKDNKRFCV